MNHYLSVALTVSCVALSSYGSTLAAQTTASNDSMLRGPSFAAGTQFSGSSINGWHTLGNAQWKASNGAITGKAGNDSGWLVLDHSYQDIGFYSAFRCEGECETGILLRMSKTPDGMTGTFPIHQGQ